MEILTPAEPTAPQESNQNNGQLPPEFADYGFTMKNLEILNYLDMSLDMFDSKTMDKVMEISEMLKDSDIQEIDLKLGNPYNMSRIDKIYTYLKLNSQSMALREKEMLIEREKNKYHDFI
jgi:hypothetical protein